MAISFVKTFDNMIYSDKIGIGRSLNGIVFLERKDEAVGMIFERTSWNIPKIFDDVRR